ncbi:hypothetical protein BH24ACT26_BH24ACT26_21750 [soil metagenome]
MGGEQHCSDAPDAGREPPALVVLTCRRCGDTFPAELEGPASCPLCGGEDADVATEPLL